MKANWSRDKLRQVLSECGLRINDDPDAAEMTDRFFSAYNGAEPEHRITAPEEVRYLSAQRI